MGRTICIDYGDKRIGVAITDPMGIIARPLSLIEARNDEQAALAIAAIIVENEVDEVVLGLPKNMDGSEGFRSEKTHKFAAILEKVLGSAKLVLFDERLTTVQADRSLDLMDVSRKDRKSKVDMMAASLLLQTYLDRKKFLASIAEEE